MAAPAAAAVRGPVSSRSGAHPCGTHDPFEFRVRRLRMRAGLGSRRAGPRRRRQIRAVAQDRNVFFFVSGGVDSTVAYTLCLRALGPERVHGTYVDTGLMREGETEFVRRNFAALGARSFAVEDARGQFLTALAGVMRPEAEAPHHRRGVRRVQQRILETEHFLDGHWILGQGTIYPDTIESGGTRQSRPDQDPSQPRRRDSEADRRGPHHRAAGVVL